jgi:hypothetical protein
MPKTKSDYSKSSIYYVYYNEELLYIGSTTNFIERKSSHKRLIIDQSLIKRRPFHKSFDETNIKFEDLRWECEDVCFESKNELRRYEGSKIRELKPKYNLHIAGRTKEEYKNETKEYKSEYEKQKTTCECGLILRKNGINRHLNSKKHKLYIENKNYTDKNEKEQCECGCLIMKYGLKRHMKTQKHLDNLEKIKIL